MSETTTMNNRPVYVVDGSRTPFIKSKGEPGPFSAVDLAVWAGRPLLLRQPFSANDIDEVILGCVNPQQDEINPGRVAALRLGCGDHTPGWTVQRNCGSGMQSLDSAFRNIAQGRANLILAGGTEALSRAPLLYNEGMVNWLASWNKAKAPTEKAQVLSELRPHFFSPIIGLLEGLTDPICDLNMGQTAEILGHQFNVSRQEADEYAVQSHQRLAAAHAEGRLNEIEPLFDKNGECYDKDDGVRPDTDPQTLATLKPTFEKPFGNVTAGNSSQISDGACWLLLASEEAVEKYQLPVLGQIIDSEWRALSPKIMGLGPVFSVTPLMQRHQLSIDNIDTWEINEAFAAQVIACLNAWQDDDFCRTHLNLEERFGDIPRDRLNVDGGAISLGHPVGTSGARIVLHALHSLKQHNGRRAIATECIGGGQGGAMLLAAA